MKARAFFSLMLFVFIGFQANSATVKQENLNKTVNNLFWELKHLEENQPDQIRVYQREQKQFLNNIQRIESQVNELALVLYAQKRQSIFAMTYSCKQVQVLYNDYIRNKNPFDEWTSVFNFEIDRLQNLHAVLSEISPKLLSKQAQSERIEAMDICLKLEHELSVFNASLTVSKQFDTTLNRITAMENYVQDCYKYLTRHVFITGSHLSYFDILEHFKESAQKAYKMAILDQIDYYQAYGKDSWSYQFARILCWVILLFISTVLVSFGLVKYVVPKSWKSPDFLKKQTIYTGLFGLFLLISALIYLIIFVFYRSFTTHTAMLITEYLILVFVILTSITLRVEKQHIKSAFYIYLPILCLSVFFILFRVFLIENDVVHFILPLLLLGTCIAQFLVLIAERKTASRTDLFYGWLSFLIVFICTVLAWFYFRFLALQIMMLWVILLTCVQFLICLRKQLGISHRAKQHHKKTWLHEMMSRLVIPVMTISLILGGLFWGAHIFDMSEVLKNLIDYNFIEFPTVISISVYKLVLLFCVGLLINYLLYVIKEVVRSIYGDDYDQSSIPIFMTVGTFVVWALYIAGGMFVLNVNSSGLAVVMGGLSVGFGFAMKDTIENLISGFSLMFGRIRLGDIIECDGIRGKVINMGYRSTIVETMDGAIIPFMNSQLFTKNFKNVTKNHGFEMAKISIGVAYGTNIDQAKSLIMDILETIPELAKDRKCVVLLDQFGDSSVDLAVVVWAPVKGKGVILSRIKEAIYTSFNTNGITIPFPQRDVHLVN